MYLNSLTLENFRSFDHLTLPLRRDLTILVGENNCGKSNLIDAIRLLTAPLSGRREIYCETSDIRRGSAIPQFELTARFTELSPAQRGRLISAALDPAISGCVFGLRYDESSGRYPVRPVLWGGHLRDTPEPGCHDTIRHVYLPPLRDAKRALASGNPTRIYALLNHFLGGDDPQDLAKELQRKTNTDVLTKVGDAVVVGLDALTSGVRRQATTLGFAEEERLIDIARDLRFKLADYGIPPEDLRYSGHGYANLLYIATIAVELERIHDADLTLFLVEEPEAHLHPQLQAAVLGFLEEKAEKSRTPRSGQENFAGQLQIVVASHSPNLSAWVDSENLVFLRSVAPVPTPRPALPSEPTDASQPPPLARRATRCLPLSDLALTPVERRKIDRYLDVTRSGMLFGGRVLLAEGIAETLLLPVIAKKLVLKDDREKLRVFRSAVFVPIDGVDFEPYLKLLLTPYGDIRIADRLVIVTDGDQRGVAEDTIAAGAERKISLEKVAKSLSASALLTVTVNTYSLEAELVRAGNGELLKSVYLKFHPRSGNKWDEAVAQTESKQAAAIQSLFEVTRKGDFAQLLAEEINDDKPFIVPTYLQCGIRALVA
jgi:putative ATP-dependent endonuclease of OLD family